MVRAINVMMTGAGEPAVIHLFSLIIYLLNHISSVGSPQARINHSASAERTAVARQFLMSVLSSNAVRMIQVIGSNPAELIERQRCRKHRDDAAQIAGMADKAVGACCHYDLIAIGLRCVHSLVLAVLQHAHVPKPDPPPRQSGSLRT
jgi:hypothetical protein